MTTRETATIFGSFEHVSFPEFGITDTVAKIDTGAFSGALHCSFIKEEKRESDKKTVLRFIPSNNHDNMIETEHYEVTRVRSSTGHLVKRYRVITTVAVKGKIYEITIGISDRSKMQREVLIGRRFLRENNILVDTRINQELDTDGEGGEKL